MMNDTQRMIEQIPAGVSVTEISQAQNFKGLEQHKKLFVPVEKLQSKPKKNLKAKRERR